MKSAGGRDHETSLEAKKPVKSPLCQSRQWRTVISVKKKAVEMERRH